MSRARRGACCPITVRLDEDVFKALSSYCEDSGQSRTVAVQRAIEAFVAEYYRKEKMVSELLKVQQ